MKPNFALNLSHDGIVLLHRASSGWHQMGEVALDAPDMAAELAELRKLATSVSTSGLATKLVIPNSQILYRSLPDPGEASRDAAIRAALDGATPYALEDLLWDSTVTNGQIQVAVIARETLEEAESFATEHRFNPISFVALPEAETYAGEPFFGRAKAADALIGSGTQVEPDEAPIHILPKRSLPPPPVEPVVAEPAEAPDTPLGEATDTEAPADLPSNLPTDLPEEAQQEELPLVLETKDAASPSQVLSQDHPSDPDDADGKTPPATDAASDTSEEAPDEKTAPVEETPAPSGFQSRRLTATEAPAETPDTTADKTGESGTTPRLSARTARFSAVGEGEAPAHKPLGPATQVPGGAPDEAPKPTPTAPTAPPVSKSGPNPVSKSDQEHPHVAVTSGDLPVEDLDEAPKPKAPRPGKSDPLPEPPPMPAGPMPAGPMSTGPLVPEPRSTADESGKKAPKAASRQAATRQAAKGALKSLSSLSTAAKTRMDKVKESKTTNKAPSAVADQTPSGSDVAQDVAQDMTQDMVPMSDRAAGLDRVENTLDEAEALTVFGARRRSRTDRRSPRLGLILTAILVVALLLIGLIAGLLPENDGQPETTQQTSALDQNDAADGSTSEDAAGTETTVLPAETILTEGAEAMPDETSPEDEPELTPELLEQAALPEPPGLQNEGPEPDLEALSAQYAATGIWPLAPENGTGETGEDDLNVLYTASIDPRISSQDAGALPDPTRHIGEPAPRAALQPAPPGTRYDYDEDGFIRATPEGTVTPDGAVVYAGRPNITPKPRPGSAVEEAVEAALAPAAVDENDPVRLALAAFQPKLRPDSLVENTEKANLGGMTRAELGEFSPKLRPASAQELAEEEARTETQDAQPRTAPVVTVSLIPKSRPQDFEKLAAAARAAEAAAAAAAEAGTTQTSAATQVTARVPASPLPQSDPANVARAATVKNAINLRRLNLMGVYGSSSDRRALVRLPSGRFAKVKIGDRLDGGRVQSIGSDNLTYVKNGRAHTLEIQG